MCVANHAEYCGNANRVAVYTDISDGGSSHPGQEDCTSTSLANFTLAATYKVPPSSGPSTIPLKVVVVEMVPSVTWGILSACAFSDSLISKILRLYARHVNYAVLIGPPSRCKTPYSCRRACRTPCNLWFRAHQAMVNHHTLSLQTHPSQDSSRTVPL